MVPAGTDAPPPNMSLAKWGFDVPVKLDKRFKKAQRLMQAKLYAEANRELRRLIEEGIRMEYHFGITAYMHILLLIAYNHGDQGEFEEGLALYEQRQTLILQEGEDWYQVFPPGLKVRVLQSFYEERDAMLAVNSLELGIAYSHVGQRDRCVESFVQGTQYALRAGSREQAVVHCRYMAGAADRLEDAEMMAAAGELLEEVGGANTELQVDSLTFRFNAAAMAQDLAGALDFAERIAGLSEDPEKRERYENTARELKMLLGRRQAGEEPAGDDGIAAN